MMSQLTIILYSLQDVFPLPGGLKHSPLVPGIVQEEGLCVTNIHVGCNFCCVRLEAAEVERGRGHGKRKIGQLTTLISVLASWGDVICMAGEASWLRRAGEIYLCNQLESWSLSFFFITIHGIPNYRVSAVRTKR